MPTTARPALWRRPVAARRARRFAIPDRRSRSDGGHDRQAEGRHRRLRRGLRDRRRRRRRLRGPLLVAHPRRTCRRPARRRSRHRDPCARGHDPPVRLPPDQEREWFRLLQTVQGVGSKVALGILSVLDPGGARHRHRLAATRPPSPAGRASAPSSRPASSPSSRTRRRPSARRSRARPPLRARSRTAARRVPVAGRGLGAGQSRLRPGPGLGGDRGRAASRRATRPRRRS